MIRTYYASYIFIDSSDGGVSAQEQEASQSENVQGNW